MDNKIYSFRDLLYYGLKCCNGGRWKRSVQTFEINILQKTAVNKKALESGKYKPKRTNDFLLNERGKIRQIKAHDINDRQIYKTFCNIDLIPKCENYVVENNSASQIGKGIEHNIKAFKQILARAYKKCKGNDFYVVTYDFHDYFASIPHDLALKKFEAILNDESLLKYLEDYSELFESGYGIGGEPSQVIAIVYPFKLDRMLLCDPTVIGSCRYMDDGVVVVHTLDEAKAIEKKIRGRVALDGLIMNEKHTSIISMKHSSVPYLKKRFFMTDTGKIIVKLIRKNINARIRCLKKQKQEYDKGKRTFESVLQSFQSWASYASRYNSHKELMKVSRIFAEIYQLRFKDVLQIVNGHGIRHLLPCNQIEKEEKNKKGERPMGFKVGATLTVWSRFDKEGQNFTKWNASTSRKNKVNDKYENDFKEFVIFCGDAKERATTLQPKDRIKLKEIDVTTTFKNDKTYYNFIVYDYELLQSQNNTSASIVPNNSTLTPANVDDDTVPFVTESLSQNNGFSPNELISIISQLQQTVSDLQQKIDK